MRFIASMICVTVCSVTGVYAQYTAPYGAFTQPILVRAASRTTLTFQGTSGDTLRIFTAPVMRNLGTAICSRLVGSTTSSPQESCSTTDLYREVNVRSNGQIQLEVFGSRPADFQFWNLIMCSGICSNSKLGALAPLLLISEIKVGDGGLIGQIWPMTSLRAYYLAAQAGSSYTIAYSSTGIAGRTATVSLFLPTGDRRRLSAGGGSRRLTFTAASSSRHLILVEEPGADDAFDFRLEISCGGPTCLKSSPLQVTPAASRVSAVEGAREILQSIVQVTGTAGVSSFSVGAIDAPWLSVSPGSGPLPALLRISVDPSSLPTGTSRATIPLETDTGENTELTFDVDVTPPAGSPFEIDAPDLSFNLAVESQQPRLARIFSVRSNSSDDIRVTAAPKSGSNWLTVSPNAATVSPGQIAEFTVRLNAAALPAGLVRDGIVIAASGVTKEVPVMVNPVIGTSATPLLSTTAMTLFAQIRQTGNLRTLQNISDGRDMILMNLGPGELKWAVSPDRTFLQTAPLFGEGLKAGEFERISIVTTPAVETLPAQEGESQESAEMRFSLGDLPGRKVGIKLRLAAIVPPRVSEAGIVLGSGRLASRSITIRHSESGDRPFQVRLPNWVEITPADSFKIEPNKPFSFTIGLKPGAKVVPGTVDDVIITFPEYFKVQNGNAVDHTLNIAVIAGVVPPDVADARAAVECVPSQLFAVFVTPGNLFRWETGLPLNIEARLLTDCGTPLQTGAATVSFSSGEPSISLSVWPDGLWRGTWIPTQASDEDLVRLRLAAVAGETGIFSQSIVFGSVLPERAGGQIIP